MRRRALKLSHPPLPAGFLASIRARVAGRDDVVPFWNGDSHALPPDGAHLSDLAFDTARDYRYAPSPRGEVDLLAALVDKLRASNGLDVETDNVVVTAGATHALFCACQAVLAPGDEVLVLAPHFPLFRGHVRAMTAQPVEVPFFSRLRGGGLRPRQIIEPYITARSSAIMLANPNNPDGVVLTRDELAELAELAREHDLWVIADEVYEHYGFESPHTSIASLPGMADRTLTTFSFSKSYAMGGLRVGYLVGPADAIARAVGALVHTIFCVPVHVQAVALRALQQEGDYLARQRAAFMAARDVTMAHLGRFGALKPAGGLYVFFDLEPVARGGRSIEEIIAELADAGVPLAPGRPFGDAYSGWARLSFGGVKPDDLEPGLRRVVAVLDGP